MKQIPDHPDIARCLCTGYAHPIQETPRCPFCNAEVDSYLKSKISGEIVGCENCVPSVDAWEEGENAP